MALAGEEIRARLSAFAAKWSVYEGSERAEAQTFLNELFQCYGTERSEVARFEEAQHGRFLDLIWPRVCLIEMKAPAESKRLAKHRAQALAYWVDAADSKTNTPSPRWVVICAFRRLEIWKDLRDLHVELDEAVAEAYGWPKHVAHVPDESNRRLLELNRAITAGEVEYRPFD